MDTRKSVHASHGLKARLKASFSVGALLASCNPWQKHL